MAVLRHGVSALWSLRRILSSLISIAKLSQLWYHHAHFHFCSDHVPDGHYGNYISAECAEALDVKWRNWAQGPEGDVSHYFYFESFSPKLAVHYILHQTQLLSR